MHSRAPKQSRQRFGYEISYFNGHLDESNLVNGIGNYVADLEPTARRKAMRWWCQQRRSRHWQALGKVCTISRAIFEMELTVLPMEFQNPRTAVTLTLKVAEPTIIPWTGTWKIAPEAFDHSVETTFEHHLLKGLFGCSQLGRS